MMTLINRKKIVLLFVLSFLVGFGYTLTVQVQSSEAQSSDSTKEEPSSIFSFFRSGKVKSKKEIITKARPKSKSSQELSRIQSEEVRKDFRPDLKVEHGNSNGYKHEDQYFSAPLVVIDPGHGGEDKGALSPTEELEKNIVLEISLMLDELLTENRRARTVLTRISDVSLSLADRTRIANESKADLFISIHANASESKNVRGIETYYLDNTNDQSSLRLAQRENSAGSTGGLDLDFILSDLIQNAKLSDSITLAHAIQDALVGTISKRFDGVKNLGVKKAPFYVLVGAHMPCILAEVSFIDHPIEGRRLVSRRYQQLIAASLYKGVSDYLVSVQK